MKGVHVTLWKYRRGEEERSEPRDKRHKTLSSVSRVAGNGNRKWKQDGNGNGQGAVCIWKREGEGNGHVLAVVRQLPTHNKLSWLLSHLTE